MSAREMRTMPWPPCCESRSKPSAWVMVISTVIPPSDQGGAVLGRHWGERALRRAPGRCGVRIHHLAFTKTHRQAHARVLKNPKVILIRGVDQARLGRIDLEGLVLVADDPVLDGL